ncbi:hypothetical protein [Gallibacterium anatis]|uniref:Competence protein C n=2 Tax=Gallibacterium anatis TaxID=750 RepID=I3QKS8_9PAST|nr:hypothetical protein [Gallibacterium anatis]AFK11673.1 competence protein C [Gallibacterium anatis]ERF79422.1 hypothetical protein N561_01350 [Gallibacterium anatis 12656/12]KGQ56817.1 hypothetical protein IO44_01795 [Gallibacterium anatis str. Avicor]
MELGTKYPKGVYWYCLNLPHYWLACGWLFLFIVICAYPLWQSWQRSQQIADFSQQIADLRLKTAQQQQILSSLQKRVSERLSSKQNTRKLSDLHQQLSQFAADMGDLRFEMQVNNNETVKVELQIYMEFQQFIMNLDLLFQSILAEWAVSSVKLERDPMLPRVLHISIQLFAEEFH